MRWRSLFRRRELDRATEAEMRTHIEFEIEAGIERGLSHAEAEREARLRLGSVTAALDDVRDERHFAWLDSCITDLRYALRGLRSAPSFTTVAVLMLAAGIGVNVMVYSIVRAVLFEGYAGVRDNKRLVYMTSYEGCCVSYPDFLDWREQARSFEGMEITHGIQARLGEENAERYNATELSAGTFRLVGQQPMLGRDFSAADEVDGAAPVVMLQFDFWKSRFAGDPGVVGRKITLNRKPTTIIGVMPKGFMFPQRNEMWTPLVKTLNTMKRDNRQTWMVVGRLKDGVSIGAARAEMQSIGQRLERLYPETNGGVKLFVENYTEFLYGKNSTLLYGSLWGAVSFVLLIVCANVANLMLARAAHRSREVSLKMALGAGRGRIVRQVLMECLLVAAAGCVVGVAIGRAALDLFVSAASSSAWMSADYSLDGQALLYAAAVAVGTGLAFGIVPALRLVGTEAHDVLKDGGRGAAGSVRGRRLSSLLVVVETALAVVLLAGAGVMVRSFLKVSGSDIGVDADHVLSFNLEWPDGKRLETAQESAFYDGLLADLDAIPGLEAASLVRPLPGEAAGLAPYEIEGAPELRAGAGRVLIAPSYFRAVGGTIRVGRDFSVADRGAADSVALVNERFATQYWPGQEIVGKRIRLAGRGAEPAGGWRTIVGVVSDIKQDLTQPGFQPLVYIPYLSNEERGVNVVARTQLPPDRLMNAIRQAVQKRDPALTVWRLEALSASLQRTYWKSEFYSKLFLSFAVLALFLAAAGIYAVMAHEVSRRTREIGVRIAVGGSREAVSGLVLRQALAPVAVGLATGLVLALATNRMLASQLVQVSPGDPVTLVFSSVALLLAAFGGCVVPMGRAVRIDPARTLREE